MVIKYNETVIDHFRNPRNMGELSNPHGIGTVGNPVCGDLMTIYIKVKDEIITDISFKTFGCAAAIATSSMITTIAKGKTLKEAGRISRQDVADKLQGLPDVKMHCSNLAADALKLAIEDYKKKKKGEFHG
jgi:nitrogen fixation NifU-like protein